MMRKRINNLFFAVGLVAVVVMCCTFEVSFTELWACIRHANGWLAAILLLWLLLYVLNAWAWRIIIRGSGPCPVSFVRLLRLTITGFALNYATPMGMIGGEAYRIMELSRDMEVGRATSSVVLFVMMHVFSHFWFWVTAIVLYIALAAAGQLPWNMATGSILAFASLFCGAGIYLFVRGYRYGMMVRLLRLLGRVPGLRGWATRFAGRHHDDLVRIDRQISELQSQNRRSFCGSLLLEYVGRLLQSFEIFFMLMLFGWHVGTMGGYGWALIHAFLILAFTSLFANLLGFLPLQMGGREGGFALSVAQLGMTGETAMFVSLICRVRELCWTSVGLLLMKCGHRHETERKKRLNERSEISDRRVKRKKR